METIIPVPNGHNEICNGCHLEINGIAGNPKLWPILIPETGGFSWWRVGCIRKILRNLGYYDR